MSEAHPEAPSRAVVIWLWVVYGAIAAMVLIGGITRLTGSGLSMVTWQPLMGALPPMSEAEWQAVFAQYQATPQYRLVNHWMTLADFERIFFWEYLHRLWGRLIGVVFFLPWLYFTVRGRLWGRWAARAFVAFVLGGLQGALGWFMVKSGLVDVPAVSHYRLAAHLGLAFFVGAWVVWLALDMRPGSGQTATRPGARPGPGMASAQTGDRGLWRWGWALVAVLAVQIVYGAFMAGTRAGYMYQTWPDLNGVLVPAGAWLPELGWRNLVANLDLINLVHRTLGIGVAVAAVAWAVVAWRRGVPLQRGQLGRQRLAAGLIGGGVLVQFALGVATVLLAVPVALGAAHQLGAYLLLTATLVGLHAFRPQPDRG